MSDEIEEIKAKVDIAELVGDYVKLTPAGVGSFKALCPFHHEKTPSFMVTSSRGRFKCFGCGEGGDIFTFLMKMENLEFPEALKILAKRAGVELKQLSPQAESAKNRLYSLLDLAARYYHKVLLDSPRSKSIREYVKERGVSEESLQDFRLGYAVNEWDNVSEFLRKRGYQEKEIFEAGLGVKKDRGSGYYDRFRDRLMFPIIDQHGRTVGFGGRAMRAEETAKYINTPQTPVYNKSAVLYGLYQAKEAIKRDDLCVLVEGYMDVIPSHQAGIANAVAISGTALTLDQLKLIKRYTNNLALALDMDAAGQRAALRSIEIALENEMNVKVVILPSGKDPGECATKDPAAYARAIKEAQPVMEYFWAKAFEGRDPAGSEDRKVIIKFLLEKIAKIGNTLEQDFWLKKIAQDLSVSEQVLRELASKLKKKTISGEKRPSPAAKARDSQDSQIFQRILAIIMFYPHYLPKVIDTLPPEMLEYSPVSDLYKKLILYYTKNVNLFDAQTVDKPEFDLSAGFDKWLAEDQIVPEKEKNFLGDAFLLCQKDFLGLAETEIKADLENLLHLCKSNYLIRRINELKATLLQAEKNKDLPEINRLAAELNGFIKQKISL